MAQWESTGNHWERKIGKFNNGDEILSRGWGCANDTTQRGLVDGTMGVTQGQRCPLIDIKLGRCKQARRWSVGTEREHTIRAKLGIPILASDFWEGRNSELCFRSWNSKNFPWKKSENLKNVLSEKSEFRFRFWNLGNYIGALSPFSPTRDAARRVRKCKSESEKRLKNGCDQKW